ncbi:MAG: ribosomal protein [Clostridia bacterium]|jgi:large subunit ribosomal protein L28|nr:ribosomal protein [Clostridia bacterium]
MSGIKIKEVFKVAKCDICSKDVHFGIKVSHSHRRSNKMWKANVRKVRVAQNGAVKTMNVCTRCLRSNLVARA